MPGLDTTARDRFLKAKLVANVPENVKTFLEMMSDKTWAELYDIFSKSNDYSKMSSNASEFGIKREDVNAVNLRMNSSNGATSSKPRFNGACNYCHKKRHKAADCFKRNRHIPLILLNEVDYFKQSIHKYHVENLELFY